MRLLIVDDHEVVRRLSRQFQEILHEKAKDTFKFEFRAIRREGELRFMLSHGRIVRDMEGNAIRMIGTHTDITETKRVAEKLEQRQAEHNEARRLSNAGRHRAESSDPLIASDTPAVK
jgi:PAS fold